MPFDQNELPKWDSAGSEPPDSKKTSGFAPGDKPPADWFNWLFNKTYKALQSLFSNAQHKEEKGKANGYAALDANGKVINADGTPAGGVQSVNNKTGAVDLSKSDIGLSNVENIKQASKTEFDTLNQSVASHLVEKAQDDVHGIKTYINSFGLGSAAKSINGIDLNTLTQTGFYVGNNMANSPNIANYYYVIHIQWSDTARYQIIFRNSPTAYSDVCVRNMSSGSWTPWSQLETTAGAQAKADSVKSWAQKKITISATAPTNPQENDIWIEV